MADMEQKIEGLVAFARRSGMSADELREAAQELSVTTKPHGQPAQPAGTGTDGSIAEPSVADLPAAIVAQAEDTEEGALPSTRDQVALTQAIQKADRAFAGRSKSRENRLTYSERSGLIA